MTRGHEHKCTWVETENLNTTLEEWIELGWELVTAYCGPSTPVTHFLHFVGKSEDRSAESRSQNTFEHLAALGPPIR
jgi:hypothetical protein